MIAKTLKKYLLIIAGSLSLGLGIIGIFIPVLPTTPFLLLSSFCYIRSSNKLYTWLIKHRIFGVYIYNYITYRAVKRNTKFGALIFLWLSLTSSILIINKLPIIILLVIIGIAVSTHILSLKTLESITPKEISSNSIKK